MRQLAALLANVACTRRVIEGVARAPRALLYVGPQVMLGVRQHMSTRVGLGLSFLSMALACRRGSGNATVDTTMGLLQRPHLLPRRLVACPLKIR